MAKSNKPKVVKVVKRKDQPSQNTKSNQRKTRPTESRGTRKTVSTTARAEDMIFGKQNYILMGAGLGLVIIGFLLMSGGSQAADSWNPDEIYSFRRTVLAPIVILAGLVVEIFAIFKKS
ncbi:MAG: hypothetical protein ACI97N_001929 [Cognaticolwellia sp.]|jgi:hypothetical protein|tara:strand:- start:105 stop:461 length:357 start_codon:yes stop_codon:yes gene_type:complete